MSEKLFIWHLSPCPLSPVIGVCKLNQTVELETDKRQKRKSPPKERRFKQQSLFGDLGTFKKLQHR